MHLFSNQAEAWGRSALALGEIDPACPQQDEAGMHQQHSLLIRAGGMAKPCTETQGGLGGIHLS